MMADADWLLAMDNPLPDRLNHYESLLTTANGRLGTRGTTPWEHGSRQPATYLAGIFDALPGEVPELVNLPDWTRVRLSVDGEEVAAGRWEMAASRLALDLGGGLFTARALWRDEDGREIMLEMERFLSRTERAAAFMCLHVTPRNFCGRIGIALGLHTRNPHLRQVQCVRDHDGMAGLVLQTAQKLHWLGIAGRAWIPGRAADRAYMATGDGLDEVFTLCGNPGETITLLRCLVFLAARDPGSPSEMWSLSRGALQQAASLGYEARRAAHIEAWRQTWSDADVRIDGDPEAQLAVRHAIFQLIGAGPDQPCYSIAAKGLSGPGYRGHVFWDTEFFMLPFFIYTFPGIAKDLLTYRHHTLDGARAKARVKGFPGAMFAWESTDTGEETCPTSYVNPETGETGYIWCGERELHITADIVHAIDQYVKITGDWRFLEDYGAEIICECARFWYARLEPGDDGLLHLSGVIGPDEYHEAVDDNAFTNAMVRRALTIGAELGRRLRKKTPAFWAGLRQRLALAEGDPEDWERAAGRIYLPAPGPGLLIEQFRGFYGLKSPIAIKQPDVLMLAVALPGLMPLATLRANWDYYEPLTDHGSSLSPAMHALVALELGLGAKALGYFRHACRIDLADGMGNTADGLHMANLGGIWQDVVLGFAGIVWRDEKLEINPRLPQSWRSIQCTLCCSGNRLRVTAANDRVEITPLNDLVDPLPVKVGGRLLQIQAPFSLELPRTTA